MKPSGRLRKNLPILFAVMLVLGMSSADAWARGRGGRGGARPRANVSRTGPARHGSYGHDRSATESRRDTPRAQEADERQARQPAAAEPTRTRRSEVDRNRASDSDFGREQTRENARDRQDDRRDRYEDRQDYRRNYYEDRRQFARGVRYSASWWGSSCTTATIVVNGSYTYYKCENAWFSRTYYGGELVYTVVDAPSGY
jgi:hypothetical protein